MHYVGNMSLFSGDVVKQVCSQTSNSSFENRISRWTCMLEKEPGGDSELQVSQDTGICCQQQCGSKSNWKTQVKGQRDKAVCVNLPERSGQIICKYCAQVEEAAGTRCNSPVNSRCKEVEFVNRLNSDWVDFTKTPIEVRGNRRFGPDNELQNFIGLLQNQIKEIESFNPVSEESDQASTTGTGNREIQIARENVNQTARENVNQTARENVNQTARENVNQTVRENVNQTARENVNQTARENVNQTARENDIQIRAREGSEISVEDQARATLEVNHTITESHQLLHVKTIIGLLHSIIDVILFAMSGSLIFDLNDSEIWKGFALRCKELESQLGILIKNFLEKKITEKMTKKKKREETVLCFIESIEERPSRSKVNRLRKSMESLMENERQLGLLQGEIIFIRDITLISESLRDLFNFMEAELSIAESKPKPSKMKRGKSGGKIKGRQESKEGGLSGEERAVSKQGSTPESTDKAGPSEQPQAEKASKGTPGDAPRGSKPKEVKPKGGKAPEKPEKAEEIKDQMVKAIQGKVGELGDQLGGHVKQMGGKVFQGLLQKAKDMTNLNINNGTSAMEDVEDLCDEPHGPSSDDSDRVSNAVIPDDNSANSNRPNILHLMHVMRKFTKNRNKASPKATNDYAYSRQRTPQISLETESFSEDSDVSGTTSDSADESDGRTHQETRTRRKRLPISENKSGACDDISDRDETKVLTHSNKKDRKTTHIEQSEESESSSPLSDNSESESSGEVAKLNVSKKHKHFKQRTINPKLKNLAAKVRQRREHAPPEAYRSSPNRQTIQLGGPKLSFYVGDVGVKFTPEGKIIDRKKDVSQENKTGNLSADDPGQSRQLGRDTTREGGQQTSDAAGSGQEKARNVAGSGMFSRLSQLSFYEKPEIQSTMIFVEEDSPPSVSEKEDEAVLSPSKDVLEFVTTSRSDSSVYTKPVFEDAIDIPESSLGRAEEPLPPQGARSVAKKAALYTCTALSLGLGSWSLHYSYKCYSECKFGCFDLYGFEKLLELKHL